MIGSTLRIVGDRALLYQPNQKEIVTTTHLISPKDLALTFRSRTSPLRRLHDVCFVEITQLIRPLGEEELAFLRVGHSLIAPRYYPGYTTNINVVLKDLAMSTPEYTPQSIVGDEAVRSRGVGVRDEAASAAELDELARMRAWTTAPKSEARVFWTGVMFLTQLPCDGVMGCDHSPGFLMLAFAWFPSIGAVIGWVGASAFDYVFSISLHAGCAACVAILVTLSVTCAFHDDGLADSADALLGGWTRDEIFKIMKDSRVGTFGCVALVMQNLTRVMLLAQLSQSHWAIFGSTGAGPALVVANGLSRATAAPLVYLCAYVVDKDDAKGTFYAWFGRSRDLLSWRRVAFSSLSAVIISLLLLGTSGTLYAVIASLLCTAASRWYGERVLNGVAGDYLGATICITEIAIYFGLVSMHANNSVRNFGPLLRMLATMMAIFVLGLYTRGKFRRRCRR